MKTRQAKKIIYKIEDEGYAYRKSTLRRAISQFDRAFARDTRWFRDLMDRETVAQRASFLSRSGWAQQGLQWLLAVPEEDWDEPVWVVRRKLQERTYRKG